MQSRPLFQGQTRRGADWWAWSCGISLQSGPGQQDLAEIWPSVTAEVLHPQRVFYFAFYA